MLCYKKYNCVFKLSIQIVSFFDVMVKGLFSRLRPLEEITFEYGDRHLRASKMFFFFLCIFFSGTKHPREDNPNLYYWAEITGLHTNI